MICYARRLTILRLIQLVVERHGGVMLIEPYLNTEYVDFDIPQENKDACMDELETTIGEAIKDMT